MTLNDPQYEPLQSITSIRVLRLSAGSDGPLIGELQQVDLEQRPIYRALSYVWGPPKFDWGITCNGQKLRIAESLHDALQHLRSPTAEIFIWADAICINQSNLKERGDQVQLMGRIYTQAQEVIIWLGSDEDEKAKPTLDLLRRLNGIFGGLRSILTKNEIKLLIRFFTNGWFERVWVFQEAVLAKSSIFVWAKEQILWSLVARQAVRIYSALSEPSNLNLRWFTSMA
jgi:Heterokaryon incompatibility protein (HET)